MTEAADHPGAHRSRHRPTRPRRSRAAPSSRRVEMRLDLDPAHPLDALVAVHPRHHDARREPVRPDSGLPSMSSASSASAAYRLLERQRVVVGHLGGDEAQRLRLGTHAGLREQVAEPHAGPADVVDAPARDAVEVGDLRHPREARRSASEYVTGRSTAPRSSVGRPPGRSAASSSRSCRCANPSVGTIAATRSGTSRPRAGRVAAEEEPRDAGADETQEGGASDRAVVHAHVVATFLTSALDLRIFSYCMRLRVPDYDRARARLPVPPRRGRPRRPRRAARADRRRASPGARARAALAASPTRPRPCSRARSCARARRRRLSRRRPAPPCASSRCSRRARRSTRSARRSRAPTARSPRSGTSRTAPRSRWRSTGSDPASRRASNVCSSR